LKNSDTAKTKKTNTNTFTVMTEKQLNEWWGNTDFKEMERISKFKQLDYSHECGYQDFVSTCDNWWNSLLIEDKQNVYNDWQ
jgi:hypothetical protein